VALRKKPQSERVCDNVQDAEQKNKEAYDESNIDPVGRCAGSSNQRGMFKHQAECLSHRRALSVEEKYRDNCLLGRREAERKQSGAKPHKLMGQKLEQKLRRI
jgi:hypothetical protein